MKSPTNFDEIKEGYYRLLYRREFGCEMPEWLLAEPNVDDIFFHMLYGVWRRRAGK